MNTPFMFSLTLAFTCLLSGCSDKAKFAGLKNDLIKIETDVLASRAFAAHTVSIYHLTDIADEKRVFTPIGTGQTLKTGDLIFIGDDIWEVKTVKIYVGPDTEMGMEKDTDGVEKPKWMMISDIQLLVEFHGKATHQS
jgi:hypothetical protein